MYLDEDGEVEPLMEALHDVADAIVAHADEGGVSRHEFQDSCQIEDSVYWIVDAA